MTKIIVYAVTAEEKPLVEAWASRHQVEVKLVTEELTVDTVDLAAGFDGVSTSQVPRIEEPIFSRLHDLGIQQIAQRSAGVDMYDLDQAKENGIIITNVPTYSPVSIAEYTLGTIIYLNRRLNNILPRTKAHNFSRSPEVRGRVLKDLTLAVIGAGHIGQELARIYSGIGGKVVAYDIAPDPAAEKYLTFVDSLEEAVAQADIVSLHMPLTKDNYHMFDADLLAQCKEGTILVNNGRGALVDTDALLVAIDSGHIASAALDTYEAEGPYVFKDWSDKTVEDERLKTLINHPKILYTPHLAYYTDDAIKALVDGGLDSALEVIETGDAKNRVN
ncbi:MULTISPECIES: D-2-hydroxyacid dehydrogenase [Aerococcus]|uniref:D-2-hydroxyacid dehydrogenase n=1 Tax=Aerococcus urinae (strain CCUG 59500 / ACS-120-V-Col10a) TaxID=2976812 RepID=UPI000200E5A8|nr:D-2-hydroxyacid dehydrogenase [Aerococcus sp. Group 1]AEA00742.1 D-lactate dehydrogenase [Aerococcus sp. Group 1]MCY3030418.1 D-2-hydroxyacid dehydrogenase [Aerococcus sp. Group 1]MCY3054830.1 D-2-hydroxyacid dehydrogenase [Aerococcus sp. Group 1]MCY3056560.1 D-2-hydroxyacid dehydrogenase [Aerococcus sp. Group 1]MCY3061858.1 D-2-hydroxyacid dehydrogenase [Aerococcus sp. Group 1]